MQGNDSVNFQGDRSRISQGDRSRISQGDREGRPYNTRMLLRRFFVYCTGDPRGRPASPASPASPSRSDFSNRLPRVFHPNRYDACAAVIILAGSVLRYVLIALGWPASYNDEGTLGLMAMHIAYNGAHPLVYYGQDYLGSLEAYLGAGFFHLLGPSTFALRLGLLPLFALFLLCMYLLAALLYSKSLALISLIVLALGAPDVLLRQLMAAGGTPEMFFFTSLLLLLTAWIAMTSPIPQRLASDKTSLMRMKSVPWKRVAPYAAWGLVAGLDLWSHLLCLPFVLCAAALLLWRCRHELRLPTLALLLVGLLIGVSPLIVYNVTTPVTAHELSLFTSEFGGGYREPSYPAPTGSSHTVSTIAPTPIAPQPILQVAGALIVGIPVATNGAALCPIDQTQAWPLSSQSNSYVLACSAVHGAWSLLLLALWSVAVIAAWRGLRQFKPATPTTSQEQAADTIAAWREANRQAARLMLLVGAGLTALAFILYPQASSVTPWTSARYLVGLLFVIPALLAPLWETFSNRQSMMTRFIRYTLLAVVLAASLLGTINIFSVQVTAAHQIDQQQYDLITRLTQMHATAIYMSYEDCNRLTFLSDEHILCAVLDQGLQPGLDRYFPFRAIVNSAPHPLYVFLPGSAQAIRFEQKAAEQHIPYTKSYAGGYIIYDPAQRIST